jgi:acyl-CoA synthetase (AMP-forming)/AMP-acid ligase II
MRLPDFFDKAAQASPQARAVWHEGTYWSYRQIQDLSFQFAQALMAQAMPAEARVASWLPNHPLFFVIQLGVHRTPLQWLPLNPRATAAECIDTMSTFQAEWLFIHERFAKDIPAIRQQVPNLRGIVVVDSPGKDLPDLLDWLAPYPARPIDCNIQQDDVVTILTTGGSTGRPKGVMRISANWATAINNYRLALPSATPPINLAATPLTHVAGDVALSVFAQGGLNVILSKPDPALILDAIGEHRITHLFVPPTLLYMMLAQPDVRGHDFTSLHYLMYGAAPISVEKLREAWSVFGSVMTQLYGLMEATSTVSIMPPWEHSEAIHHKPERLGSFGRGSPMTMVDVVDESGTSLPPGEKGEVICRGPNLFKGYTANPDATAKTLRNGWFYTGDIGVKDEQGFVRLVDRSKDLIITGGINVFPGEIEQVIWTHPSVQDCAVIGVPDEKWGEAVTAVIEVKPGFSVATDEIIAMCKERLGSIKAPKNVIVWPQLPRSNVGKVLKKDIRAHYWKDAQRAI